MGSVAEQAALLGLATDKHQVALTAWHNIGMSIGARLRAAATRLV